MSSKDEGNEMKPARGVGSHPVARDWWGVTERAGARRKAASLLSDPTHLAAVIDGVAVAPRRLEVHPSVRCSSRCGFCYNRDGRYIPSRRRRPLGSDQWRRVIADAAAAGVCELSISGGLEPTLSPAFPAIVDEASDRGLHIAVHTNGLDVDLLGLAEVLARVDSIHVGVRAATSLTFEAVTGLDADGFYRCWDTVAFLVRQWRGIGRGTVGLSMLVTDFNLGEVPEVFRKALDLGCASLDLSTDNLGRTPPLDATRVTSMRVLLKQMDRPSVSGRRVEVTCNDTLSGIPTVSEQGDLFAPSLPRSARCRNPFLMPAVDPFGDVYRCCRVANPALADEEFMLGNLFAEGGLVRVLARQTGRDAEARICERCNPSEEMALAVLDQLEADREAGIDLADHPLAGGGS